MPGQGHGEESEEDLDLDNEGQHAPAFYPADDPHQYRGETSDNAFGCVP